MNEINEIMGRSYGVPDDLDEADLDAELMGLEEELESAGMAEETSATGETSLPAYLRPAHAPELPQVSSHNVPLPSAPIGSASNPAEKIGST